MSVVTKKRYRVGGEFSYRDADGLVRHLAAGDELPADAPLSQAELDCHLSTGWLREVGWTPPPRQAEARRTPPTPQEIIDGLGLPTAGPRGVELRELDKPPSAKDLAACAAAGVPAVVVVHRLPDGTAVATIDLARLLALYASIPGAH